MLSASSSFLGSRVGVLKKLQARRVPNGRHGRQSSVTVRDGFVLNPIGDGDTQHLDGEKVAAARTITLNSGTSTIGRGPPADLLIPVPTVSGQHAEVTVGDRVSIVDLDSTNGTYVDGKEIVAGNEELLPLGSEVIFGDVHLAKFVLDYFEE